MIMLRRILMILGFVVLLTPQVGLPESYDTVIYTFAGVLIVFLLFMSRPRVHRETRAVTAEQDIEISHEQTPDPATPRALHVERTEVEERPNLHIERETIVDTENVNEDPNTDTTIEKKMTVIRRRRKKEIPSNDLIEE
jgi:hypothetical protein